MSCHLPVTKSGMKTNTWRKSRRPSPLILAYQKNSKAVDCLCNGVVCCFLRPGISGGVIDRTSAKFNPLKNGCFFTSADPRFDPSRLSGSFRSNPDIKSRACISSRLDGESVGNVRGFFTMFRSMASFDGATNGVRP